MADFGVYKPVEDWFGEFVERFTELHPRADWPDGGSQAFVDFWGAWKRAFRAVGIHDLETAMGASEALLLDPPQFRDRHLPALVAAAREIFKLRNAGERGGVDPSTWKAASDASKDCGHCGGAGWVIVFHMLKNMNCSATCECLAGRWLRRDLDRRDEKDGSRFAARVLTLSAVRTGRTNYLLHEPPLGRRIDPGTGRPLADLWDARKAGATDRTRSSAAPGPVVPGPAPAIGPEGDFDPDKAF